MKGLSLYPTVNSGPSSAQNVTGTEDGNLDKFGMDINVLEQPPNGSLLYGVAWDKVLATYPDSVTEVYTYSLAGDDACAITVIYTNKFKKFIVSVTKVDL